MISCVISFILALEVRCACQHAIVLRSGASYCGDAQLQNNHSRGSLSSRMLEQCPGAFEVSNAPFVWVGSPKNMSVEQIEEQTSEVTDGKIFILDNAVQNGLASSCREDERSVAESAADMSRVRSLFDSFSPGRGQQEYRNVYVNREGWIVDLFGCRAWRNGGCSSVAPWQAWGEHSISNRTFTRVLTLASRWGSEPWHFPMEALAALANVRPEVVGSKDLFVHVTAKTSYTLSWLEIAGVVASRVLEGELFAETLLVPQMGSCGSPSKAQLHFLQAITTRAILGTSSLSFLRPTRSSRMVEPNSLILVKRSLKNGRVVLNHDSLLEPFAKKFAAKSGLSFYIHDDDHFPSLREQLQQFSRAVLTVAPHGAALVMLLAASPKAGVLEMIDMADSSICKVCYMRLALLLGLNYFAIPLEAGLVKLPNLQNSLDRLLPEAF